MAAFETIPAGTSSKVLNLSPDRISNLLGPHHVNLVLIEHVCFVRVYIPSDAISEPLTPEAAASAIAFNILNRSLSSANETKIVKEVPVTLTSVGCEDFTNVKFARKAYNYIKSATRGGFIAWFVRAEFEHPSNATVRRKVVNAINLQKAWPMVEIILQRCDCRWMKDECNNYAHPTALLDDEESPRIESLCLCVLPSPTASGAQGETQLQSAIMAMNGLKSKEWKGAHSSRYGVGDLVFESGPLSTGDVAAAPQSIEQKREFRKLNTKQKNVLKEKAKVKSGDV